LIEPEFLSNDLQSETPLDPQKSYVLDGWELFRCCLLRTLLAYDGRNTAEGGAILRPDLAAEMPSISADGLTWTFRLRTGLRYAPPLANIPITSRDIIRALEREADPDASAGGYSSYYSVIEGFDEFASGAAQSISGLEAPDDTTLRVHVTKPTGDLGERMALPATAPIPPNPARPADRLGIAEGHDGYGPFLAASGPYMIEGSESLDFSAAPADQAPVAGLVPGTSLTLVRNPSWDPGSDEIRGAYVDRIEITVGGSVDDAAAALDRGEADIVFFGGPAPQAPEAQIDAYRDDPTKGRIAADSRDFLRYVSLNVAVPPLDDVHVRRAMNLVLNKARLQEIAGGPTATEIIGHVVLNSLEDNLLLNYDPYGSPTDEGDVAAARREMAMSMYDTNGDGLCDAPVCSGIPALGFDIPARPFFAAMADQIRSDLREIGIELDLMRLPPSDVFTTMSDATSRIGMALTVSWSKDYLNASNYLEPLFGSADLGTPASNNYTLLGATPQQLQEWGYSVTQVPGVDDRLAACFAQSGEPQRRCWADLDQYLMETVVPWIPYQVDLHTQVIPARVVAFSYDQWAALPALDQIALQPGGS
jgi:peptide/nickel transport system substrate-binding protein